MERRQRPVTTDYDLGATANFSASFGGARSLVLHLLPVPWSPLGDGYRFASRPPRFAAIQCRASFGPLAP